MTPKPTEADLFQLIKISTDSFYPLQLPSATSKSTVTENADLSDQKQELLHGDLLYDETSQALDDMLNTILDQDRSNSGLNAIFKHIEPWLTSVNEWERIRSIKSLSRLLRHFQELNQDIKQVESEEVRNFDKYFKI